MYKKMLLFSTLNDREPRPILFRPTGLDGSILNLLLSRNAKTMVRPFKKENT